MKKKFLIKKQTQTNFIQNFDENSIIFLRVLEKHPKKFKEFRVLLKNNNFSIIFLPNNTLKMLFDQKNYFQNFFILDNYFIFGKKEEISFENLNNISKFLKENKTIFSFIGFYEKNTFYNISSFNNVFIKNEINYFLTEVYFTLFFLFFLQVFFLLDQKNDKIL